MSKSKKIDDIEANRRPLLMNQLSEMSTHATTLEEQEKTLDEFRTQANLINKKFPKNSPLSVIESELIVLFKQFLFEWPDGLWKKHDRKRQNLVENFYYSLSYADFKFTIDELEYLIHVWQTCRTQGSTWNNGDFIDSIVALKVLKQKLLVRKIGTKNCKKIIDKHIQTLNMNGYALESLLNTLLHRDEYEMLKTIYNIYEKQCNGVSFKTEQVYKKIIERLAEDLSTGNIDMKSKECEFFYFLLEHKKVGKNVMIKSPVFKDLQRVGAKRVLEMILNQKPFLGAVDDNDELLIAGISREILERLLNSLVHPFTTNKRVLEVDLDCFIPSDHYLEENPEYNEMRFFYHLADNTELRPLLIHPVIETLITLKYNMMSIFNWDLILWRIVVLTVVLLNVFIPLEYVRTISWAIFTVLLVSEFYSYFESPSRIRIFVFGFLNLTTLAALFLFLYKHCAHQDCPLITGFGSLLLAINVTFIMCYFSQHVSLYVFMLFNVARNAFKFIAAISIILLGFAYCLSKNLGELDGFEAPHLDEHNTIVSNISHLEKTIFKTFVMLSGELEAKDIPYLHTISYLVFLVFVFFVPIVSLNLLSGLAVGDVQEIKSNARVWYLMTITMFLYWYETGIVRRTSCESYLQSIQASLHNLRNYLNNWSFKEIFLHLKLSQTNLLSSERFYKSFHKSTKLYIDSTSKQIKIADRSIKNCSSHTVRTVTETMKAEKLRKRRTREQKNEFRDKALAKKMTQQLAEKVNRIDKKLEKLTDLEAKFKTIANHIIYLRQTSPTASGQIHSHVRRKSL